eukprot:2647335-Pyramimonas_sp.AAC.1
MGVLAHAVLLPLRVVGAGPRLALLFLINQGGAFAPCYDILQKVQQRGYTPMEYCHDTAENTNATPDILRSRSKSREKQRFNHQGSDQLRDALWTTRPRHWQQHSDKKNAFTISPLIISSPPLCP